MKCNQNCLTLSGNPGGERGGRRLFRIKIATNASVAYSENIFVHNNSKHSRKRRIKSPQNDDTLVKLEGT